MDDLISREAAIAIMQAKGEMADRRGQHNDNPGLRRQEDEKYSGKSVS